MPQFHCGEKHQECNPVAKNCISSCCFTEAYGAVREKKKKKIHNIPCTQNPLKCINEYAGKASHPVLRFQWRPNEFLVECFHLHFLLCAHKKLSYAWLRFLRRGSLGYSLNSTHYPVITSFLCDHF